MTRKGTENYQARKGGVYKKEGGRKGEGIEGGSCPGPEGGNACVSPKL